MKALMIFGYEWKHFIRTPFKLVALLLFVAAGIFALHNGASLYERQKNEITKLNEKAQSEIEETLAFYEAGKQGPEERPWVNLSEPFWANWYTPTYHFKQASPAIAYNIGQAEQYGFYKRVTFMSSPYDPDMAEEIANPERLQAGTLDFSFVSLFLLPLLLLVCLYNVKGAESDGGFLPLVMVQSGGQFTWLLSRVSFYFALLALTTLGLMLYGALLTGVFESATSAFVSIYLLIVGYLLFWTTAFVLIIRRGGSSIGNTFAMVGVWLLFTFFIPAATQQWVSTVYPANLMTDLIDAQRDKKNELYNSPDSVFQARLDKLYPNLAQTIVAQDSSRIQAALYDSSVALTNELTKESTTKIEAGNERKNALIRTSYWFNPLTFTQHQLNRLSQTDYYDYLQYRQEVQTLIEGQINRLVLDTWNGIVVGKEKYLEYNAELDSEGK
ncbi:MAG: DUF3526 domain-containing protein [Bacteroidota bacterium]